MRILIGALVTVVLSLVGVMAWSEWHDEDATHTHWSALSTSLYEELDELRLGYARGGKKPGPRPVPVLTLRPSGPARCDHIDCTREKEPHEHYSMMPVKWICANTDAKKANGTPVEKCVASMTLELRLFNPTNRDVVFEGVWCSVLTRDGPEMAERNWLIGINDKNLGMSRTLRALKGITFRVKAGQMRAETFRFLSDPVLRGMALNIEKPHCSVSVRPDKDILTLKAP